MGKQLHNLLTSSRTILMRVLFVMAGAIMLQGCVAGQSIALPYEAEQVGGERSTTVEVEVQDRRPFIVDGDKDPNYIGHYRAGFGNPWDVTTASDRALAEIMQEDLVQELAALGFASDAASADRSLLIEIRDFNFNSYANGEFWYELEVTVFDADKNELASSGLKDDAVIDGSAWTGAKGAMEEEIPQLYALMLKAIIRENDVIMNALTN